MVREQGTVQERETLVRVSRLPQGGKQAEAAAQDGGGNASILASVANLANAAIGAGVLAFPYAYLRCGIVLGPLLTLFFALLLGATLHVIGRAGDFARKKQGSSAGESYQAIVRVILGETAEKIIILLQALYLTGCCVVMLMVIFEQIQPVLKISLGEDSAWTKPNGPLIPVVSWAVCFPLSLIRKMEWFSVPSTLSQFGIFYTVGVVVYHSIDAHLGAMSHIQAGPSLNLELCGELTQELWEPRVDATTGLVKLRLKDNDLCATAKHDDGHIFLRSCDDQVDGQLFQVNSTAHGHLIQVTFDNSTYCWHGGVGCSVNTGSCLNKLAHGFSGLALGLPQQDSSVEWQGEDSAKRFCLVAAKTDVYMQKYGGELAHFKWGTGVFIAIPLICFGFQCHLTFSLVYDSLAPPRTLARMDIVSVGCMTLCFMLYATTGVFGYALYGEATTDDILENLVKPPSCSGSDTKLQIDVTLARICIAVKVACSYGMLAYVTRKCIRDLVLGGGGNAEWSRMQYCCLTVGFTACCNIAAMYVPGIHVAMGFSGVLVVIMILFFPGWLLCAMKQQKHDYAIGVGLICAGVVIGGISLIVEVLTLTGTLK